MTKPTQYLALSWRPKQKSIRVLPGDDLVLEKGKTIPFSISPRELPDPEAVETLTRFYDWPPIPLDDWENRLKVNLVANLYYPDEYRTQVAVLQVGLLAGALTVADFLQGLESIC